MSFSTFGVQVVKGKVHSICDGNVLDKVGMEIEEYEKELRELGYQLLMVISSNESTDDCVKVYFLKPISIDS
jgi:DNA-directed RNA polymerase specialized sigma subunit